MATAEDFARECKDQARAVRRLPSEVRSALRSRVKAEVAEPMAADIRTSARTVYGQRVAGTAKVRAAADPTIVVGGAKRVASGGARARDLVFGIHFTAGRRVTIVPARTGRKGYRRPSTRQFVGRRDPFVFRTVAAQFDTYLDRWADIITETVEKGIEDG